MSHDPDAIVVPLVGGKLTFVHRRLWPALLSVGMSNDRWQRRGLSASARRLLAAIQRKKRLEVSGDAAREIARRLLARSEEVHGELGSHLKLLEQWERWSERAHVKPLADVLAARSALEEAAAGIGAFAAGRRLPWQRESFKSEVRSTSNLKLHT